MFSRVAARSGPHWSFIAALLGVGACSEPPASPIGGDVAGMLMGIPKAGDPERKIWRHDLATNTWTAVVHSSGGDAAEGVGVSFVAGAPAATGAADGLTGSSQREVPEIVALFTGGPHGADFSTRNAMFLTTSGVTTLQMLFARSEHTMTPFGAQKVLIAGGYSQGIPTTAAEIFSAATRTFATTGQMRVPRADHAAVALANGRILLTGGLVPSGGITVTTRSSEIYDPPTGTFSDGPTLTVARFNHSMIALDDGRILVLGGNNLKSAELYDPVANTFTATASMAVNHGLGHAAVKLNNGKVLVIGGDLGINIQPGAAMELFDPATNSWSTAASMSTPRMGHSAVVVPDGRVLIAGGRGADGSDLDSVVLYDPASNSFTTRRALPFTTSFAAAGLVQSAGQ